ncbi:MAG: endonuclease domain-containing protein, partial [Tardiphaga sp.]
MPRDFAKSLRTNMTDAERRLWYRLRAHRLDGIKFKRQVPIGRYVVDFACISRNLIIEVDGGQHAERETDIQRTKWLEGRGFRVLRFWNNEVLSNTDGVLEVIVEHLGHSSPAPSPGAPIVPPPPPPPPP